MKEQYEMPALTEQDRELVIALIHGDTMCMTVKDEEKAMRLRDAITLAAITAEPVGYTSERAATYEVWNSGTASFASNKDDIGDFSLYAAPPVPALKPVELKYCDIGAVQHMSGGSNDYCNGFVDGTQNAIRIFRESGYEVKE